MTVELWSLAGVASFVMKQADETGVEIVDHEMDSLKSLARLVERRCNEQYHREIEAGRS